MFKIIGSKIEKTKPYKINFKSLLINQEKNEIWIIPENNYLNFTYIFKEEGIQDQNKNYSYTNNNKLFLDPNKKHKNSVLQKKINLNLNINKDYKSSNINIQNNFSSESNIKHFDTYSNIYSNKIKNNNIKTNQKPRNVLINFQEIKSNNVSLPTNKFINNNDNFEINKTIFKSNNKKIEIKSFFLNKGNNDDNSYAFQNLINLNKERNISMEINNYEFNNDIFQIKNKSIKKIEKSPNNDKFLMKESKKYFNDDNLIKGYFQIRKYSTYMKSNINLDEKIISRNNDKNKHKSIPYIKTQNNNETFEYDGDKETVSFRYNYEKKDSKNKNKKDNKEQNRQDITSNNANNKIIDDNSRNKKKPKEYFEIIEPKRIKNYQGEKNRIKSYKYETFCEGYFISGIPKSFDKAKIIEDSTNFLSTCGHKLCSLLYSINPEILYFYKKEDLDISEDKIKNIANLSFPLGLKICLENTFQSNQMRHIPQQIFYNVIESDNGEKLYLATYYYFIGFKPGEFIEKYKCDVSKFYSDIFIKSNTKKDNSNNKDMYYIPESITIMSRYPLFNAMEICLNGFIFPCSEEKMHLMNHLINEVPLPEENSQIKFYIISYLTPIILNHNMNLYKIMSMKDKKKQNDILNDLYLSTEEYNFNILFSLISIEYIIFIFGLILLEQKILFVLDDYKTLSNIIFIFISLLYPFSWNHNIFPIISLNNINSLQSQIPYIAGIDESLFTYINKHNINIGSDVIIYNISQKIFIHSKNMKKISRKNILHENKLFNFPYKINNYLAKELKIISNEINSNLKLYNPPKEQENISNYEKLKLFKQKIEFDTKLVFIKSMIMLIGDFEDYTFFIEEEKPFFNKESYIEAHKEKDFKTFLNLLINTEMFNCFLEEQKLVYFHKKNDGNEDINIINNNKINYFNKIAENYSDLKYNQIIINNKNNLFNFVSLDIKLKAENLCKKIKLIKDDIIINSENNKDNEIQINRKKTNILFPGKNYLEDKKEEKRYSTDKNRLESYYTHGTKESKLSTETSTLNTYFNFRNKSDIFEDIKTNNKLLYVNIKSEKNFSIDRKIYRSKKKEIIDKYLLLPYFLSNKLEGDFYIKGKKEEDIIFKEVKKYKSKKKINEEIPPFINLITRIKRSIKYNEFKIIKDKAYIFPNNNLQNKVKKDRNKIKFNKELNLFKNKYYKEENNEKEIIDLNELMKNDDKIILIIKLFKSCFESKLNLNEQHFTLIKKLFINIENLEYFSNLIVPEIILRKNSSKQLTPTSFNTFSKIIKIIFENLNVSDKNITFLLTLACFVYYKYEKDKLIYLYSEFAFNKLDKEKENSEPYKLWSNESFWIEFFNCEFEFNIKENEYEENNSNEQINEENNINDKKKMCLIKTVLIVCYIMFKLNIEKNFIINIIEKMVLPVFINDFYFINEIMKLALLANNIK